jgi:hypothetical protein
MKKLLMLAAVLLGTTAMVNAQTEPAKTATSKEVKSAKHMKHSKADKKMEATKAEAKAEAKTAKADAKATPVKVTTAKTEAVKTIKPTAKK